MEEWLFWVILIGGFIGLFTIIWCCMYGCSCDDEDSGELENFQTRNINIKGQRVLTAKRILQRLGIQILLSFVKI